MASPGLMDESVHHLFLLIEAMGGCGTPMIRVDEFDSCRVARIEMRERWSALMKGHGYSIKFGEVDGDYRAWFNDDANIYEWIIHEV